MSKLGWWQGDGVCDSLIGLHAFRGCDTMSAFASRGKLSALNLLKRDITCQETFSQVHQSWDVQSWLFEKVQQFTCRMYVAASSTTELNDLGNQLFLRGWVQSATILQWLSLQTPHSSQLPGSNVQVMSACSSHIARPYQVWMHRWWWQARSPFTGCGRHQHQMLSWNCWLACVSVPASCQNIRAWQID